MDAEIEAKLDHMMALIAGQFEASEAFMLRKFDESQAFTQRKFDELGTRMTEGFAAVDRRFDRVEARLDALEARGSPGRGDRFRGRAE